MPVPFLDLARRTADQRAEIDAAIGRVLTRGRYVLGEEGAAFEREFAAFAGAAHGIGVGSGTSAIGLALRALGVMTGDGVVTVPNVSAPTAMAIAAIGARPVFVDVTEGSQAMDPDALRVVLERDASAKRIRAVVPVHLYGRPAAIGEIAAAAREHGLAVVGDAAQAHGATAGGRSVGTLSDAAAFSFYPTKNLGALGDAGMVVTDDAEVAARLKRLRNYGEEGRYRNVELGENSRLDEIQAAVLRVGLTRLAEGNARRRTLAAMYRGLLRKTPLVLPADEPGHVYHLYVVRTPDRDRLRAHLAAAGIGCDVHYPTPLHLQPAFASLGHRAGDFPVAERLCCEVLSLPLNPWLTDDDVREVAHAVAAFF
jgi:dTDP-4-amino-4,6-dideoxygalactose transaminase